MSSPSRFAEIFGNRPLLVVGLVILFCGAGLFWGQVFFSQHIADLILLVTVAVVSATLAVLVDRLRLVYVIRNLLSRRGLKGKLGAVENLNQFVNKSIQLIEKNENTIDKLGAEFQVLHRHLARLELSLEGFSFEYVLSKTGNLSITSINQSFERFFSGKVEDFKGNWELLLREVNVDEVTPLKACMTRLEVFPERENIIFGLTSGLYLRMSLHRRAVEQGIAVFGVVSDVTDLVKAKISSEQADKAKSEFLATISHEIRTPLNAIIGFSKLLQTQIREPEFANDLRNITESAEALHVILNDILEYSRIQADGVQLEIRPFDLTGLIRQVFELNKGGNAKRQVEFVFKPECEDAVWVKGDANRLRQVVQNLISNALKFTEAGFVHVKLHAGPANGGSREVFVEVSDSGIGISKAVLPKLFKRFTQADRSTHRKFGGSGLGLAICKGLIELMGGQIDVNSEPGVGSVFTIRLNLPIAAPLISESKATSTNKPAVALRVLVVDDHPLNLKLLQKYLFKKGHDVVLADGGELSVALALKQDFELILMDIDMPGMDGMEATSRIRQQSASAKLQPVICALSGLNDEKTRDTARRAGMDEYLTKPLSFDQLDELVHRVLGKRQTREVATTDNAQG